MLLWVIRPATNLVGWVSSASNLNKSSQLPQLRHLSTLDYLDTPALHELYCFDHSSRLHSFLKRLPNLQQLFVGETPSVANIRSLFRAATTITHLLIYLPMAFASDLFSLLENSEYEERLTTPALHTISICLVPVKYSPIDQDQLMRAVEAQWQGGSWRFFHVFAMKTRTFGRHARANGGLPREGYGD
jgi:hypothetical protein